MITGHEGFVGSVLRTEFNSVGLTNASGASIDLHDLGSVVAAIEHHRPDAVIHLAAQTFIPSAFSDPLGTYTTNFIGTHNLLTALKKINFSGRLLFVSTSDVYGRVSEDNLPTTEVAPLQPLNPYAVSKIAAETLCRYWVNAEHFDIVIARPFNHIGPGQNTRFAIANFSQVITEIKLGRRDNTLDVGDLEITRDFTDVRDVVSAYLCLMEHGVKGEIYNICSGIERNIRDTIYTLAELANVRVNLKIDPARFRQADSRRACGSSKKLREHTGWAPKVPWHTSLNDTLIHWEHVLQ